MSEQPAPPAPATPPPPTPPAAEWSAQTPVGTPLGVPAGRAGVRRGILATRSLLTIVIAVIVVAGAIAGFVTTRGGSSTDGTFSTGDCVTLTSSQVRLASCSATYDGKVTAVLHQSYQTCPSGSDEFDVTDGTGNLCIDRSQSSH
ncbi:MAG TPA: hypothetical protein VFC09_14385 [Candidatus Dormibacteraeota bacterium]|nr:hypothetical protein [Candidatus Dormibacteraeota bacterium]